MNNFTLIKNNLFETLTEGHRGLRTVISRPIQNRYDARAIYGRRFDFDIPKEANNLDQLFIKCTLTTSGDADPIPNMGMRVFSSIMIKTRRGQTVLQNVYPEYLWARVTAESDKPLYKHFQQALEPDTFSTETVVVYTPVLSWINDYNLDVHRLEDLTVEVTVAGTKEEMGLLTDLTAATFDLECHYRAGEPKGWLNDGSGPGKDYKGPRNLVVANVFKEPHVVVVASGATSTSFIFTCPEVVFATSFLLTSATQDIWNINTVTIKSLGSEIASVNYQTNFRTSEDAKEIGIVADGRPLTYWWSSVRSRVDTKEHIMFTGPMYPCVATLTFDALDQDYNLTVLHEYKQKLTISEDGEFKKYSVGFTETGSLNYI